MSNLTDWLNSLGIDDARAMTLTIRGTTYEAARYRDPKHPDAPERIYVIGRLPSCYRRSTHTVFLFEGDPHDWFVCAYMPADRLNDEITQLHPFGETFILTPWTHAEPIDRHEPRPYSRVRASAS
jgi:hypothetical protein